MSIYNIVYLGYLRNEYIRICRMYLFNYRIMSNLPLKVFHIWYYLTRLAEVLNGYVTDTPFSKFPE